MNRTYLTLPTMILFVTLAVPATSTAADRSKNLPYDTLVRGNITFAVNLYNELAASEGNLLVSPYSISSVMGMTYAGARENTAIEIKRALNFELEQSQLHSTFKKLNQLLVSKSRGADQKLSIANGLCLTRGNVDKKFKALLKENYDAEIFSGDLAKINDWVKKNTDGKIEKILDSLDRNEICVLLNAIYFKGVWESKFKVSNTEYAPFQVSKEKKVTVPLMYQEESYKILKKADFQAISIPYTHNMKDEPMSMIILLPQDVDGLAQLEKRLTSENLRQWLAELEEESYQYIEMFLPKFKLETEYDLVSPCKKLGIRDAFDQGGKADFSGMGLPKGELWISQIKHKVFIEINEGGTEAAAATGATVYLLSAKRFPVFRADHPFLYIIQDNQTGSILFMGRVTDPTKSN